MSNRGCYLFRQRVHFVLTTEPAHDKITIRSKNSHYRMILDDPQESRPIKWLTSKSALSLIIVSPYVRLFVRGQLATVDIVLKSMRIF